MISQYGDDKNPVDNDALFEEEFSVYKRDYYIKKLGYETIDA